MDPTTNKDLLDRINSLEAKMDRDNSKLEGQMDRINVRMEQAMGAWLFIKIMGSVAIGFTILWNFFKDWFR